MNDDIEAKAIKRANEVMHLFTTTKFKDVEGPPRWLRARLVETFVMGVECGFEELKKQVMEKKRGEEE